MIYCDCCRKPSEIVISTFSVKQESNIIKTILGMFVRSRLLLFGRCALTALRSRCGFAPHRSSAHRSVRAPGKSRKWQRSNQSRSGFALHPEAKRSEISRLIRVANENFFFFFLAQIALSVRRSSFRNLVKCLARRL